MPGIVATFFLVLAIITVFIAILSPDCVGDANKQRNALQLSMAFSLIAVAARFIW